MDFSDNFNRICRERGTTPTALLKELGVSTNKVTRWNNGSLPKQEMLVRLAHELNCSVMDFFQDEGDLLDSKDFALSEDERDIIKFYRILTLREQHIFMARMYDYENKMKKE